MEQLIEHESYLQRLEPAFDDTVVTIHATNPVAWQYYFQKLCSFQ